MNKLLSLLLLFGIVGYVSASNEPSEQWRIDNDINYKQYQKTKALDVIVNTPIISRIDSYDSLEAPLGTNLYKVETMNIETGERVSFQSTQSYDYKNNVYPLVNILAISRCEKLIKSECVVSKSNDFRVVGEDIRYSNIKEVRDEYSIVFENRARAEIENRARAEIKKQEEEDRLYEKDRELASIYTEAILANSKRDKEGKKAREEGKKLAIMNQLKKRCASYGFTGDSNISACIQREAQHDREITLQKLELQRTRLALQKSQSNSYVQPVAQVKAEEELHWTAKFLLNVVEGAAEAYVNQSQHNLMHSNDKKTNDIHKNCRPNC